MTPHALADAIGRVPPLWPDEPQAVATLLDLARREHVLPLLACRLRASAVWPALPETLHAELNRAYRQAASYHLLRVEDLGKLLAWLRQQGAEPLVIKGAALAYTHYPDPATRPHTDIDLWLPPASRLQIEPGLLAQGFTRNLTLGDTPISTQRTYYRTDANGQPHAYDLHWTLSNSPFISAQFGYAEARNRARWLPELGAYTLAPADALIYACLHWLDHQHHADQRLIWLYDLALLAGRMDVAQAQDCVAQMRAKQLQSACHRALEAALALFPTPLAEPLALWRQTQLPHEPGAVFLGTSRRARLWLDWQALGTVQAKLNWLRAYLLPSAEYLRERYPKASGLRLPGYYLRRIWGKLRR